MSNDYITAKKYFLKLSTNDWMYEFPFHTETGLLNDLSSMEKFECMYLFEMSV